MEKKGLVVRERLASNRRSLNISITEKGFKLLKRLMPHVYSFVVNTTGILNSEELASLGKLMKKIRDTSLRLLNQDPAEADIVLKRLTDMITDKSSDTK